MSDLHARITARIDELTAIAQAAQDAWGNGPWEAQPGVESWEVHAEGMACEPVVESTPEESAVHIATWDPATVLRGLAEDRDILRRHKAIEWYEGDVGCWYCSGETDASHRAVDWPCPEVLSLARRLGVDTNPGEEP